MVYDSSDAHVRVLLSPPLMSAARSTILHALLLLVRLALTEPIGLELFSPVPRTPRHSDTGPSRSGVAAERA